MCLIKRSDLRNIRRHFEDTTLNHDPIQNKHEIQCDDIDVDTDIPVDDFEEHPTAPVEEKGT